MSNRDSFQRFAAVTAIISFVCTLGSTLLQGIPERFSSAVFTDPALMLGMKAQEAQMLRWGLILDVFGYYLLLLPAALFLQHWLGPKNRGWVRFFTICGVGYIFIGGAGAAILAAAEPALIKAYAQALAGPQNALETVFVSVWEMVYGGMWNILGELLAGIWLVGIGWELSRERRLLGYFGMVVGVAALLDSLGTMLGVDALASTGLLLFVGLAPIWALWLGIDLLRRPVGAEE